MNMGAIALAEQYVNLVRKQRAKPNGNHFHFDVIMGTDMLDMSSFVAQSRRFIDFDRTCLVTYMHENQLTYPEPINAQSGVFRRNNGQRESQYISLNYKSQMASDFILFNSQFHLDSWFRALPKFLNSARDQKMMHTVDELRSKSSVLHVGIELSDRARTVTNKKHHDNATSNATLQGDNIQRGDNTEAIEHNQPPLIIWNQRWEYDKNPSQFVEALREISRSNSARYRLAICGESFQRSESSRLQFEKDIECIRENVIHCGYAPDELYYSLLDEATCTASTAHHEFFGISMLENIYHHTFPVLPNRLSYPELIPKQLHKRFLYPDFNTLVEKLSWSLNHPVESREQVKELARAMNIEQFDWRTKMAAHYDSILSALSTNHQQHK